MFSPVALGKVRPDWLGVGMDNIYKDICDDHKAKWSCLVFKKYSKIESRIYNVWWQIYIRWELQTLLLLKI